MAVFTWDAQYDTGFEEIDADHRLLVATINTLFEAMEAGEPLAVFTQLGVVHRYIAQHFEREEAIMEQYAYPDRLRHKTLHTAFTHRYTSFMDRDPKVLIVKVSVFLHDWLIHHILVEDEKFFAFVKSQQAPTVA